MFKKTLISLSLAVFIAIPAIVSAQALPLTTDGGSTAGPATTDGGASTAGPGVTDSGYSTAGPAVSPVATPITNYGGGSGSYVGNIGVVLGASSTCPLITTNLKLGDSNNSVEVAKLQSFLRNHENFVVNTTGIFDVATDAAVKAFQTKYAGDILTPWGTTQPSGFVYITTRKKINAIACSLSLTRTADEQSIIDAHKNGTNSNSEGVIGNNSGSNVTGTKSTVGKGSKLGPDVGGINALDAANAAAIGNLNIFQKFWNFLKNIF